MYSSQSQSQENSARINTIKQEKNLDFVQTYNLNSEKIDDRWAEFKINGQLISRRSNHSQAVCDGVLYVYGGYDEDKGMLSDLYGMRIKGIEQYNWENIPISKDENHPGPRKNFTLLTYQNKLYLFGGQKTNTQNTRALHSYDCEQNKWECLLQDEDVSADNLHANKNGLNTKNSQKSLHQKREFSLPPQIDSQGGVIAYPENPEKAKMIIMGGFVQPQGLYTNSVFSYSFKNNNWQFLYNHNESDKNAPRPRQGGEITINGDKLYLFGGNNNQRKFNDLWEFDLSTKKWMQLPKQGDVPEERKGHSLQFYKGYLFLFGGIQEVTKEKNDIFAYDLRKQKWKQILRNTNQYIPAPSPKRGEGLSPKKHGHSPSKRINSPRKTQAGISPLKKKQQLLNQDQQGSPNQGISPTRDHQKIDNYIDLTQPQNFLDEKKRQMILEEKQKLLDELDIEKVKYNKQKPLSPTSRLLLTSITRVGDQTKMKIGNQVQLIENKQRNTSDDFEQNLELYQLQLMQDNQKYKLVNNMLIGKKPCGRDGQSCDLLEDGKLVIFGGDRHLMSFNDTFIFDLEKTIKLNLEN